MSRGNNPGMQQSEPAAAIECVDLTRRFRQHVALDSLTLSIPRHQTFGLLGANGAGKTTFIRLVTGFLLPTSGTVTVEGQSPIHRPEHVRRQLGFVMETSRLYEDLRVRGFLRFAGGARGMTGTDLDQAIERVVESFQIGHVLGRRIGNLSKGYQQRVSLAQAFLHDPPIVIVDEPTAGLDPVQRAEVQGMLGALQGQRTVLLCTHDLHEARSLTTRVAVLHAGHLVAQGLTERIIRDDSALALFRDPHRESS